MSRTRRRGSVALRPMLLSSAGVAGIRCGMQDSLRRCGSTRSEFVSAVRSRCSGRRRDSIALASQEETGNRRRSSQYHTVHESSAKIRALHSAVALVVDWADVFWAVVAWAVAVWPVAEAVLRSARREHVVRDAARGLRFAARLRADLYPALPP